MFLICTEPSDKLSRAVALKLSGQSLPFITITESELFSSVPFAWKISGSKQRGFLRPPGGQKIKFSDIRGVLLRLSRRWMPGPGFNVQDHLFVYHETLAAWFNLFTSLNCPVINRFDLGWWLHDPVYPLRRRYALASLLEIPAAPLEFPSITPDFSDPHPTGGILIAGEVCLAVDPGHHDLVPFLSHRSASLRRWQQDSGLLCRLVFSPGDSPTLLSIDESPDLSHEAQEVIDQLAGGIFDELVQTTPHVREQKKR